MPASNSRLIEPNLPGDLNRDGIVDVNDLGILAIYGLSDRSIVSAPDAGGMPRVDAQSAITSAELSLPELAQLIEDKYYGNDGFINLLTRATRCNDAALKHAMDFAWEIRSLASETGVGDILMFAARDCIYPLGENWDSPCTSMNDFYDAAIISLEYRIQEIFREKDDACKTDPDKEIEAHECIALAGVLWDLGLIFEELFDDTLFQEKTCGLFELQVVPDEVYLSVGDTNVLEAIAKDKDGNVLQGREMIWLNDHSDLVGMNVNGNKAQITANENGLAFIEVWDKLSVEAGDLTEWGINKIEPVWGNNTAQADVFVGRGSVKMTPDRVSIIPPEFDTLKATLYDSIGREIRPTSYDWRSSEVEIVSVEGYDDYKSQGILTPVGPGVATITATESGTGLSGTAEVVVAAKMNVTPARICLPVFGSKQLSATVEDLEGEPIPGIDPYDIVWYTPDSSIASVSIDGLVIAQSEGQVQIQATYKNSLTGFSTVFVARFPDDYDVTPVYAPPNVYLGRQRIHWSASFKW